VIDEIVAFGGTVNAKGKNSQESSPGFTPLDRDFPPTHVTLGVSLSARILMGGSHDEVDSIEPLKSESSTRHVCGSSY
jgi:hypothetical protein